ncbi:MAG: endolytic transglycosylase MltG [Labilithrix sp.]|nr:endolytic transglycosylase MltG [Labilithrix sp.]MCW5816619.1 endolytic transglycosylase MltG [Labilithrix sp.]
MARRARAAPGGEGAMSTSEAKVPLSGKGERRKRKGRRRTSSKPDGKPRKTWLIWLLAGALLAVFFTYLFVIFPSRGGPGTGKDVEVVVDRDEPASAVAEKLAAAGLLSSPRVFALYVKITGLRAAPGQHLLTDDASPHELVRRLEREGHAARAKVTIPEGFTRFDIAKRLQALHVAWSQAFLDASSSAELLREVGIDGDSAEGYLFPATYELPYDSDPKEIVRRLVAELDRRWVQLEQNHRLGRAQLEQSLGWNKREILTLASMVEKEAAVDDERPIIASVFLNRLRDPAFKRKVLQCDPTSGYGCLALRDKIPACAGYTGKVTHAINVDPANTYSTYVHEGLPPGPIANPGTKSLQAVLAPATTKYLYFVVRGDRRHAFSETLEEHNTAVKDFRERTSKDH